MFGLSRGYQPALLFVLGFAFAMPARAAEVDKLLPADSDTVVYFNFRQVIDSEIVKKYALEQMKQTLQGDDAQKMLKRLGLDPLKDVDSMTIGSVWTEAKDVKWIAIVHGNFDPDKLYDAAKSEAKKNGNKFEMIKDGDDTFFKVQPDNGPPAYATLVNKTTVVVGNEKKLLIAAIKAAAENKPAAIDKELAERIGKMDEKASMWALVGVKGKLDKVQLPPGAADPNVAAQISKMETITAVVRLNTEISVEIAMGMSDADAADAMGKTVDDLLKKALGLTELLAAGDPKLKPLTELGKSLKSGVKGKIVTVNAKLSGDAIGKMLMLRGGDDQ